jgi:hypothetical protein
MHTQPTDDDGGMEGWPFDMIFAYVHAKCGPEGLRELLSQFTWTSEALEDVAVELDRHGLNHVGDLVSKLAGQCPSEIEQVLTEAEKKWPNNPTQRHISVNHWLYKRRRETGQSVDSLIKQYSLKWLYPKRNKQETSTKPH